MSYDFSLLNDKDFEFLANDILSRKIGVDFQSFKKGIDKGIDLRYASNNDENEIIVQVKDYFVSGLSKLKSHLKKSELKKVRELNPKRYILVTSVGLNPDNKEEIKKIFTPYIHNTNDILGRDELTAFLRKHPDIVERHFKLWLSGTTVLKRILKNGVAGRSEFVEASILKRLRIFVPNSTHSLAVDLLNKNNFLLITGAPGIGKTTLANMLTYQLLAEGFKLTYVRNIFEAEDALTANGKQVFYFDDFLGSITMDLKNTHNTDAALVHFIERIKADRNKRLILTCRTVLLTQATEESEKLENSKIDLSKHEVTIQDYTNYDKALILYNHIYFSKLAYELKEVFFKNNFYWKVIKHQFFTPRIVEFFTDADLIPDGSDYGKEVISFLDNPTKIWDKAFNKQISVEARLFLSTMYSLGSRYVIGENSMKEAFEARLDYEVQNNNYRKPPGIFNKVVRELMGSFINRIIEIRHGHAYTEYKFFNPSIEDFLFYHFSAEKEAYFFILKASISFEQFLGRITTTENKINIKRLYLGDQENYDKLLNIFQERVAKLKSEEISRKLNTVVVLIKLFKWIDIEGKVVQIMNELELPELTWTNRNCLIEILDYIAKKGLVERFGFSLEEMLIKLSEGMDSYYQIQSFSELVSSHRVYSEILSSSKAINNEFYSSVQQNIDESWKKSFDYFIRTTINLNTILDRGELEETIMKRREEAKKINELISISASPVIDNFEIEYDKLLKINTVLNAKQELKIRHLENDEDILNEPVKINRLFNSYSLDEWDNLPF